MNLRTTHWTFLRLINHVINLCTWCKYSHICSGMWFGSFWNRRGSFEFKISHIGISKIKSGYISICTQNIMFGISFSISITLKPIHVFYQTILTTKFTSQICRSFFWLEIFNHQIYQYIVIFCKSSIKGQLILIGCHCFGQKKSISTLAFKKRSDQKNKDTLYH